MNRLIQYQLMLFSIIQVNTVNHMLKGLNCCLDQVGVEYLRAMEESIKQNAREAMLRKRLEETWNELEM